MHPLKANSPSTTTDFDRPESDRGKSAPLYFACPYCHRNRFKSIEGLNNHITKLHDGEPPVRLPKIKISIPLLPGTRTDLMRAIRQIYREAGLRFPS